MTSIRHPVLLAWLHLIRISSKIDRRATEQLADESFDLTLAQFDVLAKLSVQQGMTQQDLAERLLVTKGNVCGLIDRLSAKGLVKRCDNPEDRRSNRLFLTEEGQRLIAQVIPAHEALIIEQFRALSDDEQQALHTLLRRVDRSLGPS
ncbi:MAG: MarR family transcriptional regulator [Chloroflexales bacterium]|nr:MarR family transcriptional regulator [Chloroflexales bacterium]